VTTFPTRGRQYLRIVTLSGRIYKVRPPYTVSDNEIAFHNSSKLVEVPKSRIGRIYLIAAVPLTAYREYVADELGPLIIFDPDFYVWSFHLERHVLVLLYNAADLEDNTPLQCLPKYVP
jgi:hypothetical protein